MIVVTTPTGSIGHQVLENVLDNVPDSGELIRVIARDPSRLPSQTRERVDVVQGSMDDIDVVTKAFNGADTVFWLVPPYSNAESIEGYALDFTRPACEAITSQGVKRVVGVSSLGRGAATSTGLGSYAMDGLIESTGVSYRALRMPGFMENMLHQVEPIKNQGMFFLPASGNRKLPTCATRDIAAAAARLLLDDSWSGQDSVPILGPEDLSYNDMAQIMSEVLQRPIRFQQVPGDAYKATLMQHGMNEAWAQGVVDLLAKIDKGLYNAEPRTPQSTTPTSFRQWCEEVLKPAVLA
ncbi:MAG: NAD-dependent epimerase/dehydratase family protein [Actinomycetia bacterium]|nr:NAD-dependent epimerase/dehydratase family protein [Actinomycetes bacterium]